MKNLIGLKPIGAIPGSTAQSPINPSPSNRTKIDSASAFWIVNGNLATTGGGSSVAGGSDLNPLSKKAAVAVAGGDLTCVAESLRKISRPPPPEPTVAPGGPGGPGGP